MQIWITQTPTGMIFRSRSAYVQKGLSDGLTKEWSYAEYERGGYACSSGMLDVKAVDIESNDHLGGKGLRRGFKLAVMEDGSLAVGVKTIAYGRTMSFFPWGGTGGGSFPAPDKTYWRWSKLSRLESGEKEPAPATSPEEEP